MSSLMRASTALTMALVVGVLPLVLDQCAASCGVHQISTRNAARPACHHLSDSTRRVESRPTSCGHDHGAAAATLVTNALASERGAAPAAAVVSFLQGLAPRVIGR